MILFPHAKINIGLDILGKRPDGYHLLDTVMIHTDWEDLLELTQAEDHTELIVTGNAVNCPPQKNIVMRAYNLLADTLGGLPPTRIHLHKNIPDGAGLGGGSADAAYTIRGLNELYNLGLDNDKMADIAARLGADCPFFIYDSPMLCTGTGTDLRPVELPLEELNEMTLAIIKPPFGVSTSEAYSGVKVEIPATTLKERVAAAVDSWQGTVTNAFEESVIPLHPEIGEIKARLLEMGAVYASMSGSGSAVYGIFPHVDSAILADLLSGAFADCQVHVQRKGA